MEGEGKCHLCHRGQSVSMLDSYCGCGPAHHACVQEHRTYHPPHTYDSPTIPNPLWMCPKCMREYMTERGRPDTRSLLGLDRDVRRSIRGCRSILGVLLYFIVLILGLALSGGGVPIFSWKGFWVTVGFPSLSVLALELFFCIDGDRDEKTMKMRQWIVSMHPVMALNQDK